MFFMLDILDARAHTLRVQVILGKRGKSGKSSIELNHDEIRDVEVEKRREEN